MKHEQSYGVIPLKKIKEEWYVLLIQHHAGHWSFPKGHPEGVEIPLETAKRELFEETGLVVSQILSDQPLEENYHFKWDGHTIQKKVHYFIAEVKGDVILQSEEIANHQWTAIEEAEKKVTFPEAKRLCRQVICLSIFSNKNNRQN